MLIRITRNSEGIEDYFETGHKKGRELSRDELDRRVHLAGDITAFSKAVEYTQKNKTWENNYYHITASFAYENNNLSDDTLRAITQDLLNYYFCDYNPEDLLVAGEAHRPITQSEVNKSTGDVNQRLLHLHLAVSMLDITTDNQVRMIPYKHEADKAFQSLIAEKYDLIDPATRMREVKQTKKEIIERWNNNPNTTYKQTKVSELRKLFSSLLAEGIHDIDDAIKLLKSLDVVAEVNFKQQKSGNQYLQVKTTVESKNINLRGNGFEALEKLYYTTTELNNRINTGKYKNKNEIPTNEDIVISHKKWWLTQQEKRKPKTKKKLDHTLVEKKYENQFKDRIKEARIYYVLYQNTIEESLIQGYTIWEKNNNLYLFNHDLGVKIFDQPNKIIAQIPDNPDARKKVVRLMLAMAKAKGWDINTLKVTGSDTFKKEVAIQIKLSQQEKNTLLDVHLPIDIDSIKNKTRSKLSAVKQLDYDTKEDNAKKNNLSKKEIESIKTTLNPQIVLDYAFNQYGLIKTHFSVTDNKINDDRTKAKPKNIIDFLTKTCNIPFRDALPILNKMLIDQEATEKVNNRLNNQNQTTDSEDNERLGLR
ncbi:MAG: hypothetical protein K9L22_08360 [Methylococcaceae bacterium]|nr:hypothetical protein [Methylococcaceae bacterium]